MGKKHDLRVTRGKFEFNGNICNRDSDKFAHNVVFDSGAEKNEANIGLQTSAENQVYVKVEDFVKKTARYSKWDKDEKKNYVKEVDWDDRFDFDEEGYQPSFGVRVKTEADGDAVDHFGYDAVEELKVLTDGQGVYVRGQLDFSSYTKQTDDGAELVKKLDFKANGVYAQKEAYVFEGEGFDADKFDEKNKFEQEIIFMGIDKHPEDDKKFLLEAYVVTYSGVESVEFIVEQAKLAKLLKKNLKPYTMINVMGRLFNRLDESQEEEEEADAWGDDTDMNGTYIPRIKELVVSKAFPDTIDKTTYTEAGINAVLKADDDFGAESKADDSEDDDEVWG